MIFDQHDQDHLRQAMHTDHRAFVNRCLSNGHLLPWMDIDTVLDRDERALLSRIATQGPVAWGGNLGAYKRRLAMELGFESVGNLKATVHKAQGRELTDHWIYDSAEWIDMSDMGMWLLSICEKGDEWDE